MSEKQYRSAQSRHNHEKAEKKRLAAMRRKECKAKWQARYDAAIAYVKKNPMKTLKIALAALLALVLLNVLVYIIRPVKPLIRGLDGLPIGVEDNWLVINAADRGKAEKYYHLADFDLPEGFKQDTYSAYDEAGHQDFYCNAVEEGGLVQNIYISAAKNMQGADYVQRMLGMGMHMSAGEPTAATVAGKEGHYVYLIFNESDTAGEGMAYSSLCIYFDTPQGSAVSAMINSYNAPLADVPTEAQLLAEAESLLAGLTLVK